MIHHELEFYQTHSIFTKTNYAKYLNLFSQKNKSNITNFINAICSALQGLLLHENDGYIFNYNIPKARLAELTLRYADDIIATILVKDKRSLAIPRTIENKLIANCRTYCLLLCAILRENNIPSRLRTGFVTYTYPKTNIKIDHVLVEYWNAQQTRWILVDPVISEFHKIKKPFLQSINFLDINSDQFISAAVAWHNCQVNIFNPNDFSIGIFANRGLYCVRNRLLQDLAALNKFEMLPFDLWGYMLHDGPYKNPYRLSEIQDLNATSKIILQNDFHQILHFYHSNPALKISSIILSDFPGHEPQSIEVFC